MSVGPFLWDTLYCHDLVPALPRNTFSLTVERKELFTSGRFWAKSFRGTFLCPKISIVTSKCRPSTHVTYGTSKNNGFERHHLPRHCFIFINSIQTSMWWSAREKVSFFKYRHFDVIMAKCRFFTKSVGINMTVNIQKKIKGHLFPW